MCLLNVMNSRRRSRALGKWLRRLRVLGNRLRLAESPRKPAALTKSPKKVAVLSGSSKKPTTTSACAEEKQAKVSSTTASTSAEKTKVDLSSSSASKALYFYSPLDLFTLFLFLLFCILPSLSRLFSYFVFLSVATPYPLLLFNFYPVFPCDTLLNFIFWLRSMIVKVIRNTTCSSIYFSLARLVARSPIMIWYLH